MSIRIHGDANYDLLKDYIDGVAIPLFKTRKRSNNTSGHKGVSLDKRSGKWKASISIKGKHYWLGLFEDIDDTIAARKQGEIKYHKPHLDKLREKSEIII